MPMIKSDLSRRFFLDVTASGHVFIREKGAGPSNVDGLPVFSANTHDEAQTLIARHCRLARDGSGAYRLNDWPEDAGVEALDAISDLFRASYELHKSDTKGSR